MPKLFHLSSRSQTFPLKLAEPFGGDHSVPASVFALRARNIALVTGHERLLVDRIPQVFILVPRDNGSGGVDFPQRWTGYLINDGELNNLKKI